MRVPYSGEKQIEANGLTLTYDAFGSPEAEPMLMVSGLGMQLIGWDEDFCQQLAQLGYWVIRFDNRDVGLSTKLDELGVPNMAEIAMKVMMRQPIEDAPYLLKDMAADAVGLMDGLGIERAHVVGISMGGMIVQELLICFADRVKTAVSLMSMTGDSTLPQPTPEAMQAMMSPPAEGRDGYVEQCVVNWKIFHGNGFPHNDDRIRQRAGQMFDRGLYPDGAARQSAAIFASGERTEALKEVKIPTLVIHGEADPLVRVEGGRATAVAIPEAKLLTFDGMGHNLPIELWTEIVQAISVHAVG